MVWFAGGMAIASLVAFFFESTRGSARRHMAYDKAMAAGRDMGQWSGRRVRHLRNKAMGPVAEKPVAPLLKHQDWTVRLEAARVLGEIGTKESLAALQAVVADSNRLVAMEAGKAIKAIEGR